MNTKLTKSLFQLFLFVGLASLLNSCSNTAKTDNNQETKKTVYPSDVIPFMDKFKMLLGDGTNVKNLVNFEAKDFSILPMMAKQIGSFTKRLTLVLPPKILAIHVQNYMK